MSPKFGIAVRGDVPLGLPLRQAYFGGLPLLRPLQARAVLHDYPRAVRRVAPDGIDPRVCATVEPGRTFDHVPFPSVGLHCQGYAISGVLPLPRR